jgi:hypothetical protein
MNSLSLNKIVLILPLLWKASAAFEAAECEWPPEIDRCSVCTPNNPADLTSGSGGYVIWPDSSPCKTDGHCPDGGQSPSGPQDSGCRVFHLTSTWVTGAPDGNAREMFMINDQFPGPKLEIFQGECVEIYYQNNSPFNTTIHFHGESALKGSQRVEISYSYWFIQELNNTVPHGPMVFPGSPSEEFSQEKSLRINGQQLNTVHTGTTHTRRHKSMMVSLVLL